MPQGAHLQAPPQGAQINPQGQQHLISQTAMRPGGPSIAFQQNPQVHIQTSVTQAFPRAPMSNQTQYANIQGMNPHAAFNPSQIPGQNALRQPMPQQFGMRPPHNVAHYQQHRHTAQP